MVNGYNQYRAYQTETATREDMVALLYDGARRFVDQALVAHEAKDRAEVSRYIGKAQMIFTELAAALDPAAGEITQNLAKLYDYWNWRLGQGVINQDSEAFREVSATLVEMHAAWVEAAKQVRAQRSVRVG
ncbi:MAG: flagellar export chaperone FliS [Mycobacterium leprae]